MNCEISSELCEINAGILDEWHRKAGLAKPFNVTVVFKERIVAERSRHKVTSKLHQTGVLAFEYQKLRFGEMVFEIGSHASKCTVEFVANGGLATQPLRELLPKLFEANALYEHPLLPPDFE